jgi:hypothetical protein
MVVARIARAISHDPAVTAVTGVSDAAIAADHLDQAGATGSHGAKFSSILNSASAPCEQLQ